MVREGIVETTGGEEFATFDPRGATTVTSPATQRQTPGGVPTRTELDLAGRSIGVIRNSLALSPAADIKVTTLTAYDNFGRPSDGTDSRGFVTHTDYDALGRPSAVTLDPGSLPHLNLTTTYGYSVAGDLVSVGCPGTVCACSR
jgi:YD repeat-containing protein